MNHDTTLIRSFLSSKELAQRIAKKAIEEIEGYQQFIHDNNIATMESFDHLPITDKACYVTAYSFEKLVGKDFEKTFHIFSSSGSSGHPFYWPQLKSSHEVSAKRLRLFLENTFRIQDQKTMAIVGLALGSWIGGDHFSWLLKSMAINLPYSFAVFAPGNKHDEIIAMLNSSSCYVDQFILACCPSAIGHLLLRAEQKGITLPLEKMRYIAIGEPFQESLRNDLEKRAKTPFNEPLMLSIYGSADTGVLGFESPMSVTLRKLALAEPAIAEELGLGRVIPHFFHQADPETFLETVGGELCVTKWQGIPLVRYNLHDNATLYDWPSLTDRFSSWAKRFPNFAPALSLLSANQVELPAPGLLAITGRSDSCLIISGTNITESMLDQAVRAPELSHILTGTYQAKLLLESGRQRLGLKLEYRTDAGKSEDLVEMIYPKLIETLGRVQPEFLDDWNSIYHTWDADPDKRILKLDLVPWPAMSDKLKQKIKQRGIE